MAGADPGHMPCDNGGEGVKAVAFVVVVWRACTKPEVVYSTVGRRYTAELLGSVRSMCGLGLMSRRALTKPSSVVAAV